MMLNMTDADYESIKNKYKEFIEYNKPKLLEFLQNVPYEEFTAALKNKLGVENLHIKYEIKENNLVIRLIVIMYITLQMI